MAKYSAKELDRVYHALANSTRRMILTRLCKERVSVGDLAEPFNMSLAAVSKHIKVLEKAGLVDKIKDGSTVFCAVNLEPVEGAAALVHYLERFLETGELPQEIEHTIDEKVSEAA